MAASVLALPSRLWEPAHWLSDSTTMAASVLAHTHFKYDGSQRAGFAIWTMAASVLAHTHFNYDGSQRAGFAIWTMAASVLAYPLQL